MTVRLKGLTGTVTWRRLKLGYWLLQHEFEEVEPLANKVTTDERNRKCGISNIIDGLHGYDEQRSRAEAYAHMNNGQFGKPCTLDDPEGPYQITGI